jgi:hypothetical protein
MIVQTPVLNFEPQNLDLFDADDIHDADQGTEGGLRPVAVQQQGAGNLADSFRLKEKKLTTSGQCLKSPTNSKASERLCDHSIFYNIERRLT